MNDHIIDENNQSEAIVIRGFDYKIEGLDGYPYLNNLIQLVPGDWEKQTAKINEVVGMENCVAVDGGGNG